MLNLYSCYVKSGVKEWRSSSSEMSGAPSSRSFEMNSAHFVLSVSERERYVALLLILPQND